LHEVEKWNPASMNARDLANSCECPHNDKYCQKLECMRLAISE